MGAARADIVCVVPPMMQGLKTCPWAATGVAQDREDLVQLICLHCSTKRELRCRPSAVARGHERLSHLHACTQGRLQWLADEGNFCCCPAS